MLRVLLLTLSPVIEFHKLESLFLEKLDFDFSFFQCISHRFPCLKDSTPHDCGGFKSIQISSTSLEFTTLEEVNPRWADLDV